MFTYRLPLSAMGLHCICCIAKRMVFIYTTYRYILLSSWHSFCGMWNHTFFPLFCLIFGRAIGLAPGTQQNSSNWVGKLMLGKRHTARGSLICIRHNTNVVAQEETSGCLTTHICLPLTWAHSRSSVLRFNWIKHVENHSCKDLLYDRLIIWDF